MPAPHLVPLDPGRWGVWRWVCLRGAGFPFEALDALASPALAGAADALLADETTKTRQEYGTEFAGAVRRMSRALHSTAAGPRFREAVAWQNQRALESGIGALLRRDPDTVRRTARHRRNEALVTSYLQRYCAKNETIGFFGPAGWAEICAGGPAVRLRPAPDGALARRTVYFEGWAVRALAEAHAAELRPWLVPRRMPLVDVAVDDRGPTLRVPFAPPVPISPLAAYMWTFIDGARTARDIAAASARDIDEVFEVLAELLARKRIAWTLDVAPDDIHPEWTVRSRLASVTDPARRGPALAAVDELIAARDAVASAGVDALAALDATFTRLTGVAATRRAGETYAGRTLVYEECLRADEVTFGPSLLDPVRGPLALLLEAARWFTAAGAELVRGACLDIYRERAARIGDPVVPFAEFWLLAHELIFDLPAELVASLARQLQDRWAPLIPLLPSARRVTVHSARIAAAVREAFATACPGWTAAVHHSPDLMLGAHDVDAILAGDVHWVLGELHPGGNLLRYATRVAYHPCPDELRRAMAADIRRPPVVLASSSGRGTLARQSNGLGGPDDVWLVFAEDTAGYDPARTLMVGACDLVLADGRLVVQERRGPRRLDLVEVLADAVSHQLNQHFRIVPPARHTPRVSIDRLVVQREEWRFTAAELSFVDTADEAGRYLAARRWVAAHDLPKHVFVRVSGELKPIYADLAGLASVDLLARAVRRARRHPDGRVTVTEMLPTPEQLWLTDARGQRYTCELRLCAVDLCQPSDP